MTSRIGVRELKNRTSEIVHDVKESAAEYIVTLRGEPVAVLRPFLQESASDLRQAYRDESLRQLDALAGQIALSWRSPKTALELLEENSVVKMPVVDASVLVALFNPEEAGHPACRRWLAQRQGEVEPIVSPTLVLAEVAAALGRGLGDANLAREAVRLLLERRLIELFPVTEALAVRAAEIALEQKIRGCDALYVALASELAMELVTQDRQQLERGAAIVGTRVP